VQRSIVALLAVCAATLCGCGVGGSGTAPPPPGNFVTLHQHYYPFFAYNSCLQNADVPELNSRLTAKSWTRTSSIEDNDGACTFATGTTSDPAVHASSFTSSNAENADFIWYSGHGDDGFIVLNEYDPTGSNEGDCSSKGYSPDVECFNGASANVPMAGRLKWIFAYASVCTTDQNWPYIFNTSSQGLHGYYGVEGEPTDLPDTAKNVADTFVSAAANVGSNSGTDVHDAWRDAVGAANTNFGEWELEDASGINSNGADLGNGDHLGSTEQSTGVYSDSNPVVYTDNDGSTAYPLPIVPQSQISSSSPGQYLPLAMTTESYSDAALFSAANAQNPGVTTESPSSNEYRMAGSAFVASHYEGSQGLIASGSSTRVPMNYAVSAAENFAISSQQSYNPLPSDAQLQNVVSVYMTTGSEAPVLIGYDFVWKHNTPILGGDFIRVGVDNTEKQVCTETKVIVVGPHGPVPTCIQWEMTYTLHLNYYYRLWREPNAVRYPTGVNGTGSPALSPAQAFSIASQDQSIKGATTLGQPLGYLYGYWTPSITSTDNTAYPAFHFFYSGHYVVSVDAYSGAVESIDAFVQ